MALSVGLVVKRSVAQQLLAQADLIVADDKDIVPDQVEHHYEHEGRSVTAVTFDQLMRTRLGTLGIDLDQIQGTWLGLAHAAMGSQPAS